MHLTLLAVASDKGNSMGVIAMRQGYLGCGCTTNGCGNAGYYGARNTLLIKMVYLFATAAKNKAVTAF